MSINRRIFRDSVAVSAIGVANSLIGFFIPLVIAMKFGASRATDGYYLAVAIPIFFISIIIGGSIRLVFIPVLIEEQTQRPEHQEKLVRASAMYLLLLSLGIVAGLAALLNAGAFTFSSIAETDQFSSQLMFELLPIIPVTILHNLYMAVYQAQQRFVLAELTVGLQFLVQLIVLIALADTWGIHAAVAGLVLGRVVAMVVMSVMIHRGMNVNPFPAFSRVPGMTSMLKFSVFAFASYVIVGVTPLVARFVAGRLDEGSVTILSMAEKLTLIPGLLIGVSLGTVLTSHWAKQFAESRHSDIQRSFSTAVSGMIMLILPISAGLYILRTPIVDMVYRRGEFDALASIKTAEVFAIFTIQIIPMYIHTVIVRVLQANKQLRELLYLSAIGTVSAITLMIVLAMGLGRGVNGIVWAQAAATGLTMLCTVAVIQYHHSLFKFGKLVRQGLKVAVATSIMMWVVRQGYGWMTAYSPLHDAVLVGSLSVAGATIYIVALKAMNHEELASIMKLILGRRVS